MKKTTNSLNLVPLYITFCSLILNYGFEFFMFYLYILYFIAGRGERRERTELETHVFVYTHTHLEHINGDRNRDVAFGLAGWLVT